MKKFLLSSFFPIVMLAFSFFLLIAGGCSSGDSRVQTFKEDWRTLPGDFWQDSKQMVVQKENLAVLLIGGAASGYTRAVHDDEIRDHFRGQHTFPRDFTIGVGSSGNPGTHLALAGGAYLYGLYAQDEQTRSVWASTLEALFLNDLLTMGLKVIAQDDSPNGEFYAWPSGHTSSTVTLATVMNEYYGPWVGVPLYALSGFVMYERMETGEHWASDVVFGAALGYVVGKVVAGKDKPQIFGMDLLPYTDPETGGWGIALAKRF